MFPYICRCFRCQQDESWRVAARAATYRASLSCALSLLFKALTAPQLASSCFRLVSNLYRILFQTKLSHRCSLYASFSYHTATLALIANLILRSVLVCIT
jgi:hypothetical protein